MVFMQMMNRQAVISAVCLALAGACPALADTNKDMQTLWDRRLKQMAKPAETAIVAELLGKMSPDGTFPDLDYASKLRNDSWGPKFQLEWMGVLVGAYLSEGPHKGDPKVKAAVLKGLESWLANDYKNSNWWWNKIGVPNRIAPTLFAFWSDLSTDQKSRAIEILTRSKMETTLEKQGTNLVWFNMVAIDRGLLTGDAEMVRKASNAISGDIRLAPRQSDGAQPDNSYLFHGSLIYTLGYGLSYLRDQSTLSLMFSGTEFAFPKQKIVLIRDWTLDGAQWMTRKQSGDVAGVGRSVARHDQQDVKQLAEIGRNLLAQDIGRAAELQAMVDRVEGKPDAKALVGNHQFWRADMMVHQRPGWYASARLYSTRTRNTECGNGEGLRSFYVADGANMLMRDGQEYYNLQPWWDWQHIPGTTVELLPNFGPLAGKPRGANDSFSPKINTIQRKSPESFVGGVSDRMYGLFGGKFSRETMSVRKSWFFFDDQYVCLGSALNCSSENSAVTTLDDRRLSGPVRVASAGVVKNFDPSAEDQSAPAAEWLLHDGVGYTFFTPTAIRFHGGPRTGDWNDISTAYPSKPEKRDMFDAWIEHKAPVKDAGYAYAVYPNIDEKSLAMAATKSEVTVASNTADCQAVWHANLNRGGAIFYAPGEVKLQDELTLTVDQPCMTLLAVIDGKIQVTVSNPENKPGTVAITLTHRGQKRKLDVKLPEDGFAGSSVTKRL